MPSIPRDSLLDSTLALLADPYGFIAKRCRRFHSDLFETRILFRKTLCMSGRPAAELFYDTDHFERSGAAPEPLRATLFGKGAVQGLDGAEHLQRKALFLQILSAQAVPQLAQRTHRLWREAAAGWPPGHPIRLYDEAQRVLTQAVCEWAGVPLARHDIELRRGQLVPLFDGAARGALRHLHARRARHQAERWLRTVIEAVRAGQLMPPAGSALQLVAWHRDAGGTLLAPRVAAVELLNVLRPTVAVSVYIVWAAHALERQPGAREALLQGGDEQGLTCFLQEVRRHYPFFPAVVARVRHDFVWNGFQIRKGRRALLDLHGTNHDPRSWVSPEQFRPDRFQRQAPGRFDFIPQGGADAQAHHRCPGEAVVLALMAAAVDVLLHHVDYTLPAQDLRIDAQRLPALPRSGLVISRGPCPPGLTPRLTHPTRRYDMKTSDHKPDSIAAADKRRQQEKHRPEAKQDTDRKTGGSTAGQLMSHPAGAMAGAAAGAAAGAVSGIAAGPVGSLAGAVVGGVTGAVVGSHSSSAAAGVPVAPGQVDGDAAAAAPSIQPPRTAAAPDESAKPD